MTCKHEIVFEIYIDDTHLKISHYRCLRCGETRKERFGIKIISELRQNILDALGDKKLCMCCGKEFKNGWSGNSLIETITNKAFNKEKCWGCNVGI